MGKACDFSRLIGKRLLESIFWLGAIDPSFLERQSDEPNPSRLVSPQPAFRRQTTSAHLVFRFVVGIAGQQFLPFGDRASTIVLALPLDQAEIEQGIRDWSARTSGPC